jgi:hypothetical protein
MLRIRSLTSAALFAALATAPASTLVAQTISFAPTNTLNGLGFPAISIVGQSFGVAATSPYLQSFTLFLGDSYNGSSLRFDAGVYELGAPTPTRVAQTGAVGSSNVLGLDAYRFTTFNLLLDPSKQYAFLLRATGVADGDPNGALNLVGTTEDPNGISGDVYAGGTFVLGDDPTALAPLDFDAGFSADFTASAVPEPATLALVGGGLLLVGLVRRRRLPNDSRSMRFVAARR